MAKHRLVLEYDGTDFQGWQAQRAPSRQPEPRTVQGCVEAALAQIERRQVSVVGAGRTDAGVHAEAQVAHAALETALSPDSLRRALNALLPRDVAVGAIEPVPDDFHARRGARSKLYAYRLWTGVARSPLLDRFSTRVERGPLDLGAMREAARVVVGTHDFSSFRAAGSASPSSVRTLSRFDIVGALGGEVELRVEGNGFLRHMVRNLAGTLLDVARGRLAPTAMADVLAARDRSAAGPTAPARGLRLVRVDY